MVKNRHKTKTTKPRLHHVPKKWATTLMTVVTLSSRNRFSKFCHWWKEN